MTNGKIENELEKNRKKVRRLYALIWLLACPLAFVLANLLGFHQVNIVYWTLLVIPVLLAVYNVRQVPPARGKRPAPPMPQGQDGAEAQQPAEPELPAPAVAEDGVSPLKRAQLIARALTIPIVIAVPILITLVVDLVLRLQK